jgi:Zn-dependent protease
MTSGSLKLGSLLGIRVYLHWSVAVIAVLLASSLAGPAGWGLAIAGVVGFLVSILVHEFSHALTARRFDVETESIQLWALGGIARLRSEAPTARAEGWIAVAGPLASAALAVTASTIWWIGDPGGRGADIWSLMLWLGVINAMLALFNLLPGAPLDGGRIVKAVRWGRHGNRFRATREAGYAGQVVAWAVIVAGFALLLRDQGGVWFMITGLFILVNAKVEIAGADLGERLDGITVGDLTWYGVAHAGPDMDADSMLWQRRRLGAAGGVAVTDDAGLVQGVAFEDEMWKVPADQRPWVMLTQLMVPFDRMARADADESLFAVLPRLDPRRPAITVWKDGRLVGLVSPEKMKARLDQAHR